MPVLDIYSIGVYMFGLFLVYVCGWVFIKPLKWILKAVLNSLFGGALLLFVNFIGGIAGVSMGVNIITATIVGFGGVPALIALFIVRFFTGYNIPASPPMPLPCGL
jgi:inhibitor of the pro-sigma K processing machinery